MDAAQHRLDVALGEDAAQLDQRLAHGEAIAVALALHPFALVVVSQFAEEVKRVGAEAGEGACDARRGAVTPVRFAVPRRPRTAGISSG